MYLFNLLCKNNLYNSHLSGIGRDVCLRHSTARARIDFLLKIIHLNIFKEKAPYLKVGGLALWIKVALIHTERVDRDFLDAVYVTVCNVKTFVMEYYNVWKALSQKPQK